MHFFRTSTARLSVGAKFGTVIHLIANTGGDRGDVIHSPDNGIPRFEEVCRHRISPVHHPSSQASSPHAWSSPEWRTPVAWAESGDTQLAFQAFFLFRLLIARQGGLQCLPDEFERVAPRRFARSSTRSTSSSSIVICTVFIAIDQAISIAILMWVTSRAGVPHGGYSRPGANARLRPS